MAPATASSFAAFCAPRMAGTSMRPAIRFTLVHLADLSLSLSLITRAHTLAVMNVRCQLDVAGRCDLPAMPTAASPSPTRAAEELTATSAATHACNVSARGSRSYNTLPQGRHMTPKLHRRECTPSETILHDTLAHTDPLVSPLGSTSSSRFHLRQPSRQMAWAWTL